MKIVIAALTILTALFIEYEDNRITALEKRSQNTLPVVYGGPIVNLGGVAYTTVLTKCHETDGISCTVAVRDVKTGQIIQ